MIRANMQLDAYLERIGFVGTPGPDFDSLDALHAAHVRSVPFENLDVQLGVPLGIDVAAAFDKIVNRRRGGWCYEQNGLFGWALAQAGFAVTRVAGAVMRHVRGDVSAANHLCLLVQVPGTRETYLCDVGFGGSLLRPLRLVEQAFRSEPFDLRLQRVDGGYWRFEERLHDDPFAFDFRAEPADENALAGKCRWLQADATSTFVQNAVAQLRGDDVHTTLRGRVLTVVSAAGRQSRVLESAAEYVATLADTFQLDVPAARSLWPAIVARHAALGLDTA